MNPTDQGWEREPARVSGTEGGAIAFFITDERGDLVDIEYECTDCAISAEHDNAARWPAYPWAEDYDSCCRECGAVVNKGIAA